jgi:hypothetical protein
MRGSFASLAGFPPNNVPRGASEPESIEIPIGNVGRRAAARLRLSIPARLVTLADTRRCILVDISRTGAQISLAKPLAEGEAAFLRFAATEVFVGVVRAAKGLNGLEFDGELSDADILAVRRYAENYEAGERRALMEEARAWVTGEHASRACR